MSADPFCVLKFKGGDVYVLRTGPTSLLSLWRPGIGFWPNRGEITEAASQLFPAMEHIADQMGSGVFVELWTVPAEEASDDSEEAAE